MRLEVISKEKNFIEFKLIGERHTLPNLLKSKLLENKDVEFVSYKLMHPLDSDAVFALRMEKGNDAVKALTDAIKGLQGELEDFEAKVKKNL